MRLFLERKSTQEQVHIEGVRKIRRTPAACRLDARGTHTRVAENGIYCLVDLCEAIVQLKLRSLMPKTQWVSQEKTSASKCSSCTILTMQHTHVLKLRSVVLIHLRGCLAAIATITATDV